METLVWYWESSLVILPLYSLKRSLSVKPELASMAGLTGRLASRGWNDRRATTPTSFFVAPEDPGPFAPPCMRAQQGAGSGWAFR